MHWNYNHLFAKLSWWSRRHDMTTLMLTQWVWSPPWPCCSITPSPECGWTLLTRRRSLLAIITLSVQEQLRSQGTGIPNQENMMLSTCLVVLAGRHTLWVFWVSWNQQLWHLQTMIITSPVPISNTKISRTDSLDSQPSLVTGKLEKVSSTSVTQHTTGFPDCQPWTRETGKRGGQALLLLFGWRHCLFI